MGHAQDPNELLEVLGDELRPVVGDDPWLRLRVQFLGPLQDDLDVRLVIDSRRSQLTMYRLQPSRMLPDSRLSH